MTTTITTSLRSIVTPRVLLRLAVGWGSVLLLLLAAPLLDGPLPTTALLMVLAAIVTVILLCSFGVVHEAEHLARRLGDPYGSLVLTLSIVMIEVVLISAVMLGPGDPATIARDSVFAVSMIILNAVIGVSLLVAGIRHGGMAHNRAGTSAYFAMVIVLAVLAFGLPAVIGVGGSYAPVQAVLVAVLSMGLYAFFLARQMGPQSSDFTQLAPLSKFDAGSSPSADPRPGRVPAREVFSAHGPEVLARLLVLLVTVLPIVLLSHHMAALLDEGLSRAGAPVALSGILIALIVFLPETITTVRAALAGEGQRVSNLCHGALVSTVGLTIPVVLLIGLFTAQTVTLALSPADLMLLGVSLLLTVASYAGQRTTAIHGAAHLAVFAVYALVVFS